MVSDVELKGIHPAVIAVGFLTCLRDVVLLNPARAERVKAEREGEGGDKIGKGRYAPQPDDQRIEGKDDDRIGDGPAVEESQLAHPQRAHGHDRREQQQPHRLADLGPAEQSCFPVIGKIDVDVVDALIGMMPEVVTLEERGARYRHRKIGKNGGKPIGGQGLKDQTMGTLMDCHPQGMVDNSSDRIRSDENAPPRKLPDAQGDAALYGHAAADDRKGPGIGATQFANLGMLGEDASGSRPMRFRRRRLDEVSMDHHTR